MKKALSTLLQALLFLIVFAVGSFMRPFHLTWNLATAVPPGLHRSFVPDGLLLALALFIVIAIIQAFRRRLCHTTWTTIAFFIAIAAGFFLKLGFITREL